MFAEHLRNLLCSAVLCCTVTAVVQRQLMLLCCECWDFVLCFALPAAVLC